MSKPTLGSLFAGIGGIDLGFERAGFETIFQVELDPFCRRVLAKNFPNADRSIIDVKCGNSKSLPRVDVLAGGFPCQDISVAGRGAGITGSRSGLWKEFHRIIGDLRPRYVLVENVPALLGRGLDVVLGDLTEIGYDAEWEIISAAAVGALHLRKRVWIVAYPMQMGCFECTCPKQATCYCGRSGPADNKGWKDLFRVDDSEFKVFSPDTGQERTKRIFTKAIPRFDAFSWCEDVRRLEDLRDRPDLPPPLFRGTRDGLPNWSHRVGALGNSVVPQIPEYIAGLILEDMKRPENGQGVDGVD